MKESSRLYKSLLIVCICLFTINVSAQREIWAISKSGDDSMSIWLYENSGALSSANVVYARMNNHGSQEDMGISLGYARYEKAWWISTESMVFLSEYADSRFGLFAVEGGYNILSAGRISHISVQGARGTYPVMEKFRIRIPSITAYTVSLHLRIARENQIGSAGPKQIQDKKFNVNSLVTTEVAFGPCITFFRHLKMGWNQKDNPRRRGAFFSVQLNAVMYPIKDYSYTRNPYASGYAEFIEDSLQPGQFAWRLRFDGRFKYLTQRDIGFSWHGGFMRSAFGDGIFYFAGIGLYYGWGKRRNLELDIK